MENIFTVDENLFAYFFAAAPSYADGMVEKKKKKEKKKEEEETHLSLYATVKYCLNLLYSKIACMHYIQNSVYTLRRQLTSCIIYISANITMFLLPFKQWPQQFVIHNSP